MASDHEIALAFIARRQARRAMTAARWCHLLSLELGWMNPGQARGFVEAAVRAGLLAQEGEDLRLVIDPQAIDVPRGFRPRPHAAVAPTAPADGPAPEPDLFLGWVAKVAAQRSLSREQVLGQVAALQESMGGLLTGEAAILVLARRCGLDVARAAADALKPSRAGRGALGPAGNP